MSVDQRRTETLRSDELPGGKLRLAKASSRYDRRRRYLVVEWCPPRFVGADLEEYAYRVLQNWHPVGDRANQVEAEAAYVGALHLLRVMAQEPA